MKLLKSEDPAKFKRQFANWEKCLAAAKVKTCEDLYKKVHAAVIANPDRAKAKGNSKPTRKQVAAKPNLVLQDSKGRKWLRHFRLTRDQRKERSNGRLMAAMQAAHAAMGN